MPNKMKPIDTNPFLSGEMNAELENRHDEVKFFTDLELEKGTAIPALFVQYYKFVANPSTISVETFKRMVDTDETIGSGVDFLATCLAARLGKYQHESEEITDWVNKRLEEIEEGWIPFVKEMLSASWAGFFVGEKVWANTDNGFVPQRIIPLPPTTILFEVERGGKLTDDGILQYQRNWNPMNTGYGGVQGLGWGNTAIGNRPDPLAKLGDLPFPLRVPATYSYLSVRIPKLKCIHFPFNAQGSFGNPYGRSLLRRIYKYYVMKDSFLRMLATALDRKGTPLNVVFADPNTTLIDPTKADASNPNSARGKNVGMRADVAARDAFKNVHNDSTIILPGKKDQIFSVETIQQASNSGDFLGAITMCNQAMLRGLLIPALIFSAGDGSGSYSLGQEHAKTWEKILDGMLAGAKNALIQQLVKEMICYNFPKSAWQRDGFGEFSKRELTQDEKKNELEALDKAVTMGAIDMNDLNDLNKVRDVAGFPPRETIIVRDTGFGIEGDEDGVPDGQQHPGQEQDDEGDFGGAAKRPQGIGREKTGTEIGQGKTEGDGDSTDGEEGRGEKSKSKGNPFAK